MITLIDSLIMLLILPFAFLQANLEAWKAKTFYGELWAWSLACLLTVVIGFKLFDRFYSDPASILDLFKHLAFLVLAGKYYFLTKKT